MLTLVVRIVHDEGYASFEVFKVKIDGKMPWVQGSVKPSGSVELEVVTRLLNNYPLRLAIVDVLGPVLAVDAGKDEDGLFRAVEKLQELGPMLFHIIEKRQDLGSTRWEVVRQLFEKPTLENVKKFIKLAWPC